jgi:hypothetical protein
MNNESNAFYFIFKNVSRANKVNMNAPSPWPSYNSFPSFQNENMEELFISLLNDLSMYNRSICPDDLRKKRKHSTLSSTVVTIRITINDNFPALTDCPL